MLDDAILDVSESLNDPVPILSNRNIINSYHDYLTVNYKRIHGGNLTDYVDYPQLGHSFAGDVRPFIDKGVWKWVCGSCGHGYVCDKGQQYGFCLYCLWPGQGQWVELVFPNNLQQVETLLLQMPGRRATNFLRDWKVHWTEGDLEYRIDMMNEKMRLGEDLRKLSIAPTRTATVGEILRSGHWNNNIKEPIDDLSGDNGPIEFRNAIVLASFTTAERDVLVNELVGMLIWNTTISAVQYYDGSEYRTLLRIDQAGIDEMTANTLITAAITAHLNAATHGS